MEIEEFLQTYLDNDRVLYQRDEVEDLIRKAMVAALGELRSRLTRKVLRLNAQMDQEEARIRDRKMS